MPIQGNDSKDAIEEITWNHDAVDAREAFIHVRTKGGKKTILNVERMPNSWLISVPGNFEIRLKDNG